MGTLEGSQPEETPADAPNALRGSPVQLDQVVRDESKKVGDRALQQIAALPEICTGVNVTNEEGVCIVTFNGRGIEDGAVGGILLELAEIEVNMVLDFSGVAFLSNVFLNKLIQLQNSLKAGQKLILCSMRPEIREVFIVTRLYQIFDIHATRKEALASFTNPIPPRPIGLQ